jgi:hypothetical protein
MPRYFFNIQDGKDFPDDEGSELAGPEEAREHAIVVAGAMLKDHGRHFWNHGEWRMLVLDESGATVCSLRFAAEQNAA